MGYLAAFSIQYVHLGYEGFFISNLVTLAIGGFLLAMAAIDDIKGILHSIDDQCTKNRSKKKRLQALNQVREFVQMHSALKQLSNARFVAFLSQFELELWGKKACSTKLSVGLFWGFNHSLDDMSAVYLNYLTFLEI